MTWRTLLSLLVAAGLGCASTPGASRGPAGEAEAVAPDWRGDAARAAEQVAGATSRAAGATWQAARSAKRKVAIAAVGLRKGFERPARDANYGAAPPADYAATLRGHFRHVLRFPEDTRFRIGRPQKGYMNEGLLQGGGVAWCGYLIDVEVAHRSSLFGDAQRTRAYVVRLRDGQVIDVHAGAEHDLLARTQSPAQP